MADTNTIIYVTATGPPDACVNGNELELRITEPGSTVESTIVIALDEARMWASDVYAAVTIAHRDHTADPTALTDYDLAALPDPGRIIVDRFAETWSPAS